jgi:hypothetical protein
MEFEADAAGIGIRAPVPGSAIRSESTPAPDQHVKKFELYNVYAPKKKTIQAQAQGVRHTEIRRRAKTKNIQELKRRSYSTCTFIFILFIGIEKLSDH